MNPGVFAIFGGLGSMPRPIAKEDARGAVGVVDDPLMYRRRFRTFLWVPAAPVWTDSEPVTNSNRPRSGRTPPRGAPRRCCTRQAVEGNIWSGVTVQT